MMAGAFGGATAVGGVGRTALLARGRPAAALAGAGGMIAAS